MFSCEFCDIFRTPFLIEHLWWLLLSREINSCSQVFCKKSCSEQFSWKTRPMTLLRWTQFFSCKFWKGSRKTFSKNTSSSRLKFVFQFTALYISIIKSALCEKCRFRSFSGPYFPAFGLNTEKHSLSRRVQYEYGNIRTRKAPNTDTFYAVVQFQFLKNKANTILMYLRNTFF